MRSTIITTILGLFLICGLKAQSEITLPIFSEESIVMKVCTEAGDKYIYLSDGLTNFDLPIKTEQFFVKDEKEKGNIATYAIVINSLKKQGYKLITSTQTTFKIKYLYFQKE